MQTKDNIQALDLQNLTAKISKADTAKMKVQSLKGKTHRAWSCLFTDHKSTDSAGVS